MQALYAITAYPEYSGIGFGQNDPIEHWNTRVTSANSAVQAAIASGYAGAGHGLLVAAQAEIMRAKDVISFQKKEGIWTKQGEEAVAARLETARGAFEAAQGLAGRPFPTPFPTWNLAKAGALPGESAADMARRLSLAERAPKSTFPTTFALVGVGLVALVLMRSRRR